MGFKPLLVALVYFVIFYIMIFFSFFILFLFSKIYRFIREVDIDEEIEKKDNLGLSIFLSIILMGLALFVDKPVLGCSHSRS